LSALLALVTVSVFANMLSASRDPQFWLREITSMLLYGAPLCFAGWLLALPLVLKIRQTEGWHFWAYLALGGCIGPITILIVATCFELATRSPAEVRHVGFNPKLGYLATGVSFLTTLFYLFFLRRPQRTFGRKRIGFMTGQLVVPEDFDRMHDEEIERLFDGSAGAQSVNKSSPTNI
jgi:hypothetical protein